MTQIPGDVFDSAFKGVLNSHGKIYPGELMSAAQKIANWAREATLDELRESTLARTQKIMADPDSTEFQGGYR